MQYCIEGGITKAGFALDAADKANLAIGKLPPCAKLYGADQPNDVHLSAVGYKVLANAVYEAGAAIDLW